MTANDLRALAAQLPDDAEVPITVEYGEVANKYIFVRIDAATCQLSPPALQLEISLVDPDDEERDDD